MTSFYHHLTILSDPQRAITIEGSHIKTVKGQNTTNNGFDLKLRLTAQYLFSHKKEIDEGLILERNRRVSPDQKSPGSWSKKIQDIRSKFDGCAKKPEEKELVKNLFDKILNHKLEPHRCSVPAKNKEELISYLEQQDGNPCFVVGPEGALYDLRQGANPYNEKNVKEYEALLEGFNIGLAQYPLDLAENYVVDQIYPPTEDETGITERIKFAIDHFPDYELSSNFAVLTSSKSPPTRFKGEENLSKETQSLLSTYLELRKAAAPKKLQLVIEESVGKGTNGAMTQEATSLSTYDAPVICNIDAWIQHESKWRTELADKNIFINKEKGLLVLCPKSIKLREFGIDEQKLERFDPSVRLSPTNHDFTEELSEILTPGFSRLVSISGHAEKGEQIAGLPPQQFKKLMSVLTDAGTIKATITSCYLGGENIQNLTDLTGNLSFPLILSSFRDKYSYVGYLSIEDGKVFVDHKNRKYRETIAILTPRDSSFERKLKIEEVEGLVIADNKEIKREKGILVLTQQVQKEKIVVDHLDGLWGSGKPGYYFSHSLETQTSLEDVVKNTLLLADIEGEKQDEVFFFRELKCGDKVYHNVIIERRDKEMTVALGDSKEVTTCNLAGNKLNGNASHSAEMYYMLLKHFPGKVEKIKDVFVLSAEEELFLDLASENLNAFSLKIKPGNIEPLLEIIPFRGLRADLADTIELLKEVKDDPFLFAVVSGNLKEARKSERKIDERALQCAFQSLNPHMVNWIYGKVSFDESHLQLTNFEEMLRWIPAPILIEEAKKNDELLSLIFETKDLAAVQMELLKDPTILRKVKNADLIFSLLKEDFKAFADHADPKKIRELRSIFKESVQQVLSDLKHLEKDSLEYKIKIGDISKIQSIDNIEEAKQFALESLNPEMITFIYKMDPSINKADLQALVKARKLKYLPIKIVLDAALKDTAVLNYILNPKNEKLKLTENEVQEYKERFLKKVKSKKMQDAVHAFFA